MPKVLVVDDSPIDRLMAGNLLAQGSHWEVEYANDGQQGLEVIRNWRPDLVVTDMQMPELDGLQLACAVRSEFPDIAVVLMTARGSEEIALEALQAGAASYVPKRALAQRLVETTRRVMTARHDSMCQREALQRLTSRSELFELENDLELLLSLSRYLQLSLAQQWGLDLSNRLQVGQALEEAFLNALYHGNLQLDPALKETDDIGYYAEAERRQACEPYCDRRIFVEVRMTPQAVTYVIRDEGTGFDQSRLPSEAAPEDLDRPYGRGVLLMRAFMDSVVFNERGNQVTMSKQRMSPVG